MSDRNLTLLTDFYQLTMMNGYLKYDRKDEIVQKLTDKGRNVGAHRKGELPVGIFAKSFAYCKVQGVVDNG